VRALEVMRQATYMLKLAMVCCTPPERSLTLDRMADGLDSDLVDGEPARVLGALNVGNG